MVSTVFNLFLITQSIVFASLIDNHIRIENGFNAISQKYEFESNNELLSYDDTVSKGPIENSCQISRKLKKEIQSYQPIVNEIVSTVVNGQLKGVVYKELAKFVDTFGSRLTGTRNLESALSYLTDLLKMYMFDEVYDEQVEVPRWIRGNESAEMLWPRYKKFNILGLGGSVGTPSGGITASVIVVDSFEELKDRAAEAEGKIVVYNQDFVSYGESVKYRSAGASEAARVGAVAALVRSVTPFSLDTPHTGQQHYATGVTHIPVASITIEDAQMLRRMTNRGIDVIVRLHMEASTLSNTTSRNVVGDLLGSLHPEKIVLLSGHVDSWDVGQGAMDDGAGAFVSWFSVHLLNALGLRPTRTVRAVLWTAEEQGLIGARQYAQAHMSELNDFNLVMESDGGTFTPKGVAFTGSKNAGCILQEIAKLMKPLNATQFVSSPSVGSDIAEILKYGVPGAELINENEKYFWFHHTNADTMTVLNSDELDKNVAMFAAVAYVVADLSVDLPRDKIFVPYDIRALLQK